MEQRTNAEDWPARLIRPWLAEKVPYAAPATPESIAARLGIRPETLIKLDQNENPYGCPEPVRQAIYESQKLNRYPDPEARECREAIAEYAGAPLSRIAVGNGADELIEVLSRLLINQGDAIVSAVPSFGYYQTVAEMSGAAYRQVERGRNWLLPVDKLIDECQRGVKMLLIGSPNNPTGDTIGTSELLRLVEAPCLVVIDEAYFEFSKETALDTALSRENVVILRSFSKWAGLAGLRIGYGIFPEWLTPYYQTVRPPYSVNAAAQIAALVSLQHRATLMEQVQLVIDERERLFSAISALPYLKPAPSRANFILCQVDWLKGAELWDMLLRRGIVARTYGGRLEGYIRFSVGRPEEDDQLIAALEAIGKEVSGE